MGKPDKPKPSANDGDHHQFSMSDYHKAAPPGTSMPKKPPAPPPPKK